MKVKVIVLIVGLLGMLSCRKGLDRPKWDVDAYIPLLTSTLKIEDSFGDSLITSGPDGKLKLVYNDNLISIKLDSLFEIPDTTIEDRFSIPIGTITLVPGQPIITDTQTTDLDVDDFQLKRAIVRSGQLEISMHSTIGEKTIFNYSIPSATLNGVPLSSSINVPAGSLTSPSVASQTIDISGYNLDLTGFNGNEFNKINLIFNATVDPNGSNVVVSAGNYIKFTNSFVGIVPEYGQGFFGTETQNESGTEDSFDVFKNFGTGNVALSKANLIFKIKNEVGVDVSATIQNITGRNSQSGDEVSLQHSLIGKKLNLNRATIDHQLGYPPIQPSVKEEIINDQNSNVTDFVSVLPDQLEYAIEFTTNPLDNISNGFDFIYYNTGFEISLDAEIPLEIAAENLVISDTAEFTIDNDSQEDAQRIQGGQLLLHAWNGYPLDTYLQFYLLDDQHQILDSLFTESQLLPAGTINANNIISDKSFTTAPVPLTSERIDLLYETHYILIKASISTAGYPDPVQLYSDYNIDLKLVGDFSYEIDPDNL